MENTKETKKNVKTETKKIAQKAPVKTVKTSIIIEAKKILKAKLAEQKKAEAKKSSAEKTTRPRTKKTTKKGDEQD